MSKNHVVGLLGCGYWGTNYVNTLADLPNIRLKYICDVREPKQSLTRKAEGFTTDYTKLLNDSEVDSIIIATPTQNHYEATNLALKRGKNVLVEKPITSTSEEAKDLDLQAKESNKTLMVGHVFMYHPAVTRLKDYIDSGELGAVKSLTARRLSLGPIRPNENVIWDLMPHDISMFLYLSGGKPISVNATGHAFNGGLEDIANMSMKFDNGSFASVMASWIYPLKTRDLTVVGDKKMAIFDDTAHDKLALYDHGATINGSPANPSDYAVKYRVGDVTLPHVSTEAPLKLQCNYFFDCIDSGEEPRSNGENGRLVVKILEAAQQSLKDKGREVIL